jgi:Transposase zinc-binding domain
MSRPPLEVADLIRAAGAAFIEQNRPWIRWSHVKVMLAIARCRTAALGGHVDECTRCGYRATISYNSCLMESNFYWRVRLGWSHVLAC